MIDFRNEASSTATGPQILTTDILFTSFNQFGITMVTEMKTMTAELKNSFSELRAMLEAKSTAEINALSPTLENINKSLEELKKPRDTAMEGMNNCVINTNGEIADDFLHGDAESSEEAYSEQYSPSKQCDSAKTLKLAKGFSIFLWEERRKCRVLG